MRCIPALTRMTALVVSLVAASSADANYCMWSGSDENQCPETSRTYHQLLITDYWGNPQSNSGADSWTLGTWSNLLVACRSNQIYFVKDATAGSYPSTLLADSALCLGDGNDALYVKDTNWTCGSQAIGPFAYGLNRVLHIHGQDGDDRITGGAGRDKICGGTLIDWTLAGGAGNDEIDGGDNPDRLRGGSGNWDEMWGYTSIDCIDDTSGTHDYLNGESQFDRCLFDKDGAFDGVDCGPADPGRTHGGYSPNAGSSRCDTIDYGYSCWNECDFSPY